MNEMLAFKLVFVLMGKESSKGGEVLERMKELLKDFVDVFSAKLLGELHFLRDIQQLIDLVSGSNIHN